MRSVHVDGLVKRYGGTTAVDGISFDVDAGEVFTLLGPNGAGKTTTMEVLEGHRRRDGGTVEVLGVDPANGNGAWRARLGIMLQSAGVESRATVLEVVRRFAAYYPRPRGVDEVLGVVGLDRSTDRRVETLSGGQRRRLDLALALVGGPEVLFLDEPTTGFDPVTRSAAWSLISDMAAEGVTVLLTTHDMSEAEALAQRVAIVADGQVQAQGTVRELSEGRPAEVSFALDGGDGTEALPPGLSDLAVTTATPGGDGSRVVLRTVESPGTVAAVLAWADRCGVRLVDLTVRPPGLANVYLQYAEEER